MMTKKLIPNLLLVFLVLFLSGCDYVARYRCEWFITPEPDHRNIVEHGYVSVCLRNFEINKQQCFLKASMSLAQKYFKVPIRYVDVEISTESWPHEIVDVKKCSK